MQSSGKTPMSLKENIIFASAGSVGVGMGVGVCVCERELSPVQGEPQTQRANKRMEAVQPELTDTCLSIFLSLHLA